MAIDAVTALRVAAAMDASAYTAGARQVEAANEAIAESGEAVVRTQERAAVAARAKSSAIERLARELDTTYRAQQQMERAQNTINAALERGAITAQRAAQLQSLAQERYAGGAAAATSFAAANDNAGRSASRFGQIAGQAGFQVGDFAAQVAGGQSALVAFGQQASQFLGIFGPAGAIAGAIATVGVLAVQLAGAGTSGADAARKIEEGFRAATAQTERLRDIAERVDEFLASSAERAARISQRTRQTLLDQGAAELRQLTNEQVAAGNAMLMTEQQLQRLQQARNRLNADLAAAPPRARPSIESDLRDLEAEEFTARSRRQAAQADAERASAAIQRLREQEERLRNAQTGAERDQAERQAEEARRDAERASAEAARSAERAASRQQSDAARAREQAAREEQRDQQRREAEAARAQEQAAREDQRDLERREAANRRTTDDIVRYASESFADLFAENSRGWEGMLDSFLGTFRRLMARIAADAIIRPIVSPIVSSLGLGDLGGLAGGGAAGAGAAGGGVLSQLGQFSGLSNLLPSGGLSGLMSAPLWGGAVQGPALPGLAASGAPLLGTVLGYGGLGALGGGLLATLTGGNQMGGSIGGGAGAMAGAAIGSIVPGIGTAIGALIGGAGGGLLGGMFGGGKGFSGGDALVGVGAGGQLEVRRYAGKNFDDADKLMQETAQQVAGLNQTLAGLGLRFDQALAASEWVAAVGGGESPNARDIGGALAQRGVLRSLRSDDRRVQYAIDTAAAGGADLQGVLRAAQAAQTVAQALDGINNPLGAFAQQINAVRAQADALIAEGRLAGFVSELDEIAAWRDREVAKIEQQRTDSIAALLNGVRWRGMAANGREDQVALQQFDVAARQELRTLEDQLRDLGVEAGVTAKTLEDLKAVQQQEREALVRNTRGTLASLGADILGFLNRLRTTDAGGYSATEQLANARASFDASLGGARLNDPAALRRITGDAEALLGAARDVYASGEGFVALRRYVETTLGSLDAARLAQAQGANAGLDALADAFSDGNDALIAELARLRAVSEAQAQLLADIATYTGRTASSTPPTPVGVRA